MRNVILSLNLPITLAIFLLISISILIIYSSSRQLALNQSLFALAGFLIYCAISRIDYRSFKDLLKPIFILNTILLLVVLVLGIETRGSTRWVDLGLFSIQPSEFIKPVIILLLADFWSRHSPTWINIFHSLLWVFVPIILVFIQPDLGTALTISAIWVAMLFAAKISFKKITILLVMVLVLIPIGWTMLLPYQKERITSFLSPNNDPLGVGYNLIQSTIAVGSGQIIGQGLGRGTQSRLQFLPEFRTDFIFASIAEELGLVGSTLMIVVYLLLIIYCLKVAEKSSDSFGYLVCFGVAGMLLFQSVVNIGMNVGILPITGITLPMISYGGSSLMSTFICLGFIASVLKYQMKIDITAGYS